VVFTCKGKKPLQDRESKGSLATPAENMQSFQCIWRTDSSNWGLGNDARVGVLLVQSRGQRIVKVISNIGNLFDYSQSTEGGLTDNMSSNTMVTDQRTYLFANVCVTGPQQFFDFVGKIASDAMLANVHSASPTAYIFEWFMSLVNMI